MLYEVITQSLELRHRLAEFFPVTLLESLLGLLELSPRRAQLRLPARSLRRSLLGLLRTEEGVERPVERVITSYSIHYTKLYEGQVIVGVRNLAFMGQKDPVALEDVFHLESYNFV